MIKIDYIGSIIYTENKDIYISQLIQATNSSQKFDWKIRSIILDDKNIFLSLFNITTNKKRDLINTIFKFNKEGGLIYKTGLLTIEYPINSGKFETWEASNMAIIANELYLGYSRGYEAWADIETGEILRGNFENRK